MAARSQGGCWSVFSRASRARSSCCPTAATALIQATIWTTRTLCCWCVTARKRGHDFNMRFGQPSASLPSDPFPFNEMGVTDPVSGRSDGLLKRLAVRHRVPNIFFTNTSCEYWRGDASLIHTDATGTRDIEPIASSRFYHFAGTQHSAGTLPLTDTNPQNGERGPQALNSVDYNPPVRAPPVQTKCWHS